MPRIGWGRFAEKYPRSVAFEAITGGETPRIYDRSGRQLPSPYGLFREWLERSIDGDWASLKLNGSFAVRFASEDDVRRVLGRFAQLGPVRKTRIAPRTCPIGYFKRSFWPLAKELGYEVE